MMIQLRAWFVFSDFLFFFSSFLPLPFINLSTFLHSLIWSRQCRFFPKRKKSPNLILQLKMTTSETFLSLSIKENFVCHDSCSKREGRSRKKRNKRRRRSRKKKESSKNPNCTIYGLFIIFYYVIYWLVYFLNNTNDTKRREKERKPVEKKVDQVGVEAGLIIEQIRNLLVSFFHQKVSSLSSH